MNDRGRAYARPIGKGSSPRWVSGISVLSGLFPWKTIHYAGLSSQITYPGESLEFDYP